MIVIVNLNPITIVKDEDKKEVVDPYFDRDLLDYINQNNLQVGDVIKMWKYNGNKTFYKTIENKEE